MLINQNRIDTAESWQTLPQQDLISLRLKPWIQIHQRLVVFIIYP
jgi:hypothetical protein